VESSALTEGKAVRAFFRRRVLDIAMTSARSMQAVVRSAPDGYTLAASPSAINASLHEKLSFNSSATSRRSGPSAASQT
jgi:hypothetical protein